MSRKRASEEEIEAALAELPGWEVKEGKLHKQYKFKTFSAAMGWMVSVGIEAEKMDHHPEWSNVYNRVMIKLTTHDAGGLTKKDIALAQKIREACSKQ